MKSITKGLIIIGVLVGVISLLGYLTISYGSPYRVSIQSVIMDPDCARVEGRVTFIIQVRNDGQRLSNVQIRVVQPANPRGEGTVFRDLTGQVINPGVNTYRVSGTLRFPTPDKHGVIVKFLDRSNPAVLPAPVITSSAYLNLYPGCYMLQGPLL